MSGLHTRRRDAQASLALLGLLLIGGAGCEDEIVTSNTPPVAAPTATATATSSPDAGTPRMDFQEAEFTESDRSRDPFRANSTLFVEEVRGKVRSQREVVLDHYALDELKLVGIVTRIEPAKAMLVDPTGKGHVVQRGQFVGRPEVVQSTGARSTTYEINWRVDRIRDGDIVLVREDPANPDVPSSTKVIPLRPEVLAGGEGARSALQ
jgi:type IV pilus assembly protein PilP